MGGEKQPGIDCLYMHEHSQRNLGICLHLEIVSEINMYTFDIHIFISSKDDDEQLSIGG